MKWKWLCVVILQLWFIRIILKYKLRVSEDKLFSLLCSY